MILPQSYAAVMFLTVLSLLCLGSWAALMKSWEKWRFEVFYLDFAIGLLLAAVVYAFTFGNLGYDGFNFIDDLQHAGKRQWMYVFGAGILFNLGNMLLMGAVSVAGMAVAFPIGLGVAILVGTGIALLGHPLANAPITGLGCLMILLSAVLSASCYRILATARLQAEARAGHSKSTRRPTPIKGMILPAIAGLLIGGYTPLVEKARLGDLGLGPYAVGAIFAFGVFFSSFVFDIFFMNLPVDGEPVEFTTFLTSPLKQHLTGWLSGILWFTGVLAAWICTSVPEQEQIGPLAHVTLSQASPVIAALWGILVFRELKEGDFRVKMMGILSPVLFLLGLALIGLAPVWATKG